MDINKDPLPRYFIEKEVGGTVQGFCYEKRLGTWEREGKEGGRGWLPRRR